MNKFNEVFVFIDTNAIEGRHDGALMFLSKIAVSNGYNKFKQFVNDTDLQDKIHINISEIVLNEIKRHMIDCFKAQRSSFIDVMTKHKVTFGDILDVSYDFGITDEKQYEDFVNGLLNEFFADDCIVSPPVDETTINKLIQKALNTDKPFTKPRVSGSQKEYTDAGFKDALIYETFLSSIKSDALNLFVSNDDDFSSLFDPESDNIKLCKDFDEAINYIKQNFTITQEQDVVHRFKTDKYLQKTIAIESGLSSSDSDRLAFDSLVEIQKISKPDSDENDPFVLKIKFYMYVGMKNYLFVVEYDPEANEVISVEAEGVINE